MLKKITIIMANIDKWPSQKFFEEIKETVRTSKFREDAKGHTYTSNVTRYEKQIKKETEIVFADCIIKWLGNRIRLTKLSDDLVNSLADDTHLYCRYLEQYFTQSQKDVRDANSFTWNRGRRLFYIILDIIAPNRNVLSGALIVKAERKQYQSEQKSINFDDSIERIYKSEPKTKMISFNPVSLFRIRGHKRHLSKWFRESKTFDIEGFDEKLTPSEYLESCCDQILSESGKKELSYDDMSKLKNQFTRKFRPWLVESINAYWFDIMVVAEEKKHHKSQHVSQPLQRRQPIKFYDRYTLCLIVHAWFENDSHASVNLDYFENSLLKARLQKFFPKSKSYFTIANEEVDRINKLIELEIKHKAEIKSESEVTHEEINLVQKEKLQAWSDWFKKKKFGVKTEEKLISGLSVMKDEYCEECKALREYEKEKNESRYELRCPICGSESEDGGLGHGKVALEAKRLRLNSSNIETPSRKTKMKDWERKIWDFKSKVFSESHIPLESQKRIESVIRTKIKLIKRFKNPITYE